MSTATIETIMAPVKRSKVQFPFRSTSPQHLVHLNRRISRVLDAVDRMIYEQARRKGSGRVDDSQIQEIVQRCRIWLWEKSLPKYDAWRTPPVKVSTFLYQCVHNFMKQEFRGVARKKVGRRQMMYCDPDVMLHTLQARDTSMDDRIAAKAEDILYRPECYLTEAQVIVFKAMIDNPTILMKDLAVMLGYQRASSLSMMTRRIRDRLTEIDIEEDGSGFEQPKTANS